MRVELVQDKNATPLCAYMEHYERFTHSLENLKRVADAVTVRNAFINHLENLPLSMLVDERRQVAVQRILDGLTRTFAVPWIKFEVTNYIDLIDWTSEVDH